MRRAFLLMVLATGFASPIVENWCEVGQVVMIPDGREGPVTQVEGNLCKVLVYGQKYESPWPFDQIEPAYPRPGR